VLRCDASETVDTVLDGSTCVVGRNPNGRTVLQIHKGGVFSRHAELGLDDNDTLWIRGLKTKAAIFVQPPPDAPARSSSSISAGESFDADSLDSDDSFEMAASNTLSTQQWHTVEGCSSGICPKSVVAFGDHRIPACRFTFLLL
jgi:hypothetical protein